jgi:hypothetical protein
MHNESLHGKPRWYCCWTWDADRTRRMDWWYGSLFYATTTEPPDPLRPCCSPNAGHYDCLRVYSHGRLVSLETVG